MSSSNTSRGGDSNLLTEVVAILVLQPTNYNDGYHALTHTSRTLMRRGRRIVVKLVERELRSSSSSSSSSSSKSVVAGQD